MEPWNLPKSNCVPGNRIALDTKELALKNCLHFIFILPLRRTRGRCLGTLQQSDHPSKLKYLSLLSLLSLSLTLLRHLTYVCLSVSQSFSQLVFRVTDNSIQYTDYNLVMNTGRGWTLTPTDWPPQLLYSALNDTRMSIPIFVWTTRENFNLII